MAKTSDPFKITKYNSGILAKWFNVGEKFTETYTVQIIEAKYETTYQLAHSKECTYIAPCERQSVGKENAVI